MIGETMCSPWILFLAVLTCSSALYTSEPPVKLISVDFFGERFPAANSEYRTSVTDGKGEDVPAELNTLDEANGMPEQKLILMPDGCATYELPVKKEDNTDKLYLMIKPGRKEGEYWPDFMDKADITLAATAGKESAQIECGVESTNPSSQASDYCVLNITSIVPYTENQEVILGVTLCVPSTETRAASLWELWVSPEDDSRRAEGTFEDVGRERLRRTQDTEEFNTFLTMTSIVGKTGVGKSTVASFLAGNLSMFTIGSTAEGTTTIGTDVSPIIPSEDYISVMEENLQDGDSTFNSKLYQPEKARPLFFLDSEGMSFRGDEFDFITSGPAAKIAKNIIWITVDRFHPPEILEDIKKYLTYLDRISMGEDTDADSPSYGKFLIVLNKMWNEDVSDDEMRHDLMTYSGDEDSLETIKILKEKFEDVRLVGLPVINVHEGEEFGYSVLSTRFREGLKKLANYALEGSETPRIVNVGNDKYEMNSTEAITIVSMLTDAANSGNIDLSDPCNVISTVYEEKIGKEIRRVNEDIASQISPACSQTRTGMKCSQC